MAVIVDCSEKRKNSKGQLVKTVCKNYHSRKHKKQRNKYNQARKKYQNHKNKGKKKQPIMPAIVPAPTINTGAKIKKRIEPVILNAPPPAAARVPTAGQQRVLNTIDRMEKHYSNKTHNLRNVVRFRGRGERDWILPGSSI